MQLSPAPEVLVTERIRRLRQAMREAMIDACVVPTSDPHLSEYLSEYWQACRWLAGFDGSAGTLVLTQQFAGLWTDSRYWIQAERQLAGTPIVLMKISGGNVLSYADWLAENLTTGATVALDGRIVSLAMVRQLLEKLDLTGLHLRMDYDPVGSLWDDRPSLPTSSVYEHPSAFTALTRAEKLERLRAEMATAGADWHFLSTLDDIAWLLNLRGADMTFNPLFISCLLVGMNRVYLFVDKTKISAELQRKLSVDGIVLQPYDSVTSALERFSPPSVLLLDPRRVTAGIFHCLESGVRIVESVNPTLLLKSRKAESEIAHVRQTMEQDGAALCEFFTWLDTAAERRESITELTVAEKMALYRSERPGYIGLSFDTIAGFNENGALPHYRATAEHYAVIDSPGLLLLDSGGQYFGGTTDITRVVPVGEPLPEQKRDFTMVLKGLIALSRAYFPRGIRAAMLDAIARAPLWQQGLDYGHGTGHGVGYFLNVHEGPQSISCHAAAEAHTAMEEGMITSIEPGVYRPGRWGVRLENLVVNRKAAVTEFGEYLCFETLTLCPFDTRCIDPALLTRTETAWINHYHEQVRERLLPLLSGKARDWLTARTHPIPFSPTD